MVERMHGSYVEGNAQPLPLEWHLKSAASDIPGVGRHWAEGPEGHLQCSKGYDL